MTLDPGRVQAVFLAALKQENVADRAAVLDRECEGDEALRCRVETLLIAHDKPDSLLDRPFALGEQVAAIRMSRVDQDNEVKPPSSEPEPMR